MIRSAAIAATALVVAGCGSTHGAFDGARWREPVEYCTASPRAHMTDAAIEAVSELKTHTDVRRVLGPPDARNDGDWFYNVGKRTDGMLDECVMVRIEFRPDAVVATVVTDS